MVVEVLVVGVELVVLVADLAQQPADHLTHRQDDATELHQRLAPVERGPLHLVAQRSLVEQRVLEVLELVVHDLHRVEMAVDDDVEQPVHQGQDAVLEQRAVLMPAGDDRVHVELAGVADGDQRVADDERRHPGQREVGAVLGQLRGVGGDEGVVCVPRHLRAFVRADRVLDRVRVQRQLVGQRLQTFVVGGLDVHPDQVLLLAQLVRQLVEREILLDDLALAPHLARDHVAVAGLRFDLGLHLAIASGQPAVPAFRRSARVRSSRPLARSWSQCGLWFCSDAARGPRA